MENGTSMSLAENGQRIRKCQHYKSGHLTKGLHPINVSPVKTQERFGLLVRGERTSIASFHSIKRLLQESYIRSIPNLLPSIINPLHEENRNKNSESFDSLASRSFGPRLAHLCRSHPCGSIRERGS